MKVDDRKRIETILRKIKKSAYTAGYKATDEEAMGLLVARYFGWAGLPILKTTYSALEDSNFHTENEGIEKLINKLEAE